MGSCESIKCRDVYREWQHWHSQMAWPDLAYSIKMLWTTCSPSQSQLEESSPLLEHRWSSWLHLPGPCTSHKEEKCVEHKLCHKTKEWPACSTGSKESLGLLGCLEPILLLFQSCVREWTFGCREPRLLPVSSSSQVFLSGTNVAVLTPKITPKHTFVYSLFSISMVL